MEPIYELKHKDQVIHTGDLDSCFEKLMSMVGEYTGLATIFKNGWGFYPISDRRVN